MKKKKSVACTVSSIEQEGNFYLLTLKCSQSFKFKPGQFVKLYLAAKGKDFEPFSFFSAPEEKEVTFMFDSSTPFKKNLSKKKKGTKLYIEGPYGDFTVSKKPDNSVLLCRGLGLIPLSSIGKSLIDKKKKHNIYIMYENMDRKEILNENRLIEFENHKQVNLIMTLLNERPMDWPGKIGPITSIMIKEFVPGPRAKDYYVCGPSTFVNRMLATLEELKVPKKRISTEPWD